MAFGATLGLLFGARTREAPGPSIRPRVPMSALGQKRTWRTQFGMFALPPKADIGCLPDYLISDLLETQRWTTTLVYARDAYWVTQNAANADACL